MNPIRTLLPDEPVEKNLSWKDRFINLAYVFASSIAGLVGGAGVVYFVVGMLYVAFFSGGGTPSEECARGTAVGFLSIITGAYLGTVGGSIFAVKHPLCKKH